MLFEGLSAVVRSDITVLTLQLPGRDCQFLKSIILPFVPSDYLLCADHCLHAGYLQMRKQESMAVCRECTCCCSTWSTWSDFSTMPTKAALWPWLLPPRYTSCCFTLFVLRVFVCGVCQTHSEGCAVATAAPHKVQLMLFHTLYSSASLCVWCLSDSV